MATTTDLRERLAGALGPRYSLERELGRGGAATVYLARDLRHDRSVALKVLDPELSASLHAERFLREVRIAAHLTHPHILPLHDSGEADGLLYYAMPFVEGESLRARLRREGQLPVDAAVRIAREVAEGLDYAHRHGIVHRDVKPENILLEDGHAVVADFGIALAVEASGPDRLTEAGFALGTPTYMSPEQCAAERSLDSRSDIYSLGCVLYEMLAGEPPFGGPAGRAVGGMRLRPPGDALRLVRPAVPEVLARVIARTLEPVPADRYASAAAFAHALDAASSERNVATPSDAPRGGRALPRARPRTLIALAAVASLLAGAAVTLARRGSERSLHADVSATAGQPPTGAAAPQWILVAEFEHPPGDRTLGLAVRELVSATLEESKAFAMVPRDQVQSARRAAQLADTALLTGERALHVAYRSAVRTVVEGRVDAIGGTSYSVLMHAIGVEDGNTLASATGSATEATMIPTVQRLARRIGSQLGTRGDSTARRAPGTEGITPSFDAYRRWAGAADWHARGDFGRAARLSREAVHLDPRFAAAWLQLGTLYQNLDEDDDSARVAFSEARRFADRLTPADRHRLDARTASQEGDGPAAIRSYDRLLEESPSDALAYLSRGMELRRSGRYEDAIESIRRGVEASPLDPAPLIVSGLVNTLAPFGRIDEARAVNERLTGTLKRVNAMIIAVSAADWTEAETLATALEGDPTLSTVRRRFAALTVASAQASRGQVSAAEESIRRAAALTTARPLGCFCHYTSELGQLLLTVASGRASSARRMGPIRDTTPLGLIARGLWSAFDGDTASARRDLRALRARPMAQSDPVQRDVPLLEASIAAQGARWLDVVRLVGPSGWRGEPGVGGGGLNMRRWLAAEAYERLGRPDSAAAYFELLTRATRTDWGELQTNGMASSFAHRRLALLYTQLGRASDARRHWQAFIRAFTDPDPEFRPLLDDARRRLATLG
jgi:serine/threonine-protein kinase